MGHKLGQKVQILKLLRENERWWHGVELMRKFKCSSSLVGNLNRLATKRLIEKKNDVFSDREMPKFKYKITAAGKVAKEDDL